MDYYSIEIIPITRRMQLEFPRVGTIRKVPQPKRKLFNRSFWQSLIAVLAGNAIYYSIERYLPPRGQHQLYRIDWGLAVDFWICVICYFLVRMIP